MLKTNELQKNSMDEIIQTSSVKGALFGIALIVLFIGGNKMYEHFKPQISDAYNKCYNQIESLIYQGRYPYQK